MNDTPAAPETRPARLWRRARFAAPARPDVRLIPLQPSLRRCLGLSPVGTAVLLGGGLLLAWVWLEGGASGVMRLAPLVALLALILVLLLGLLWVGRGSSILLDAHGVAVKFRWKRLRAGWHDIAEVVLVERTRYSPRGVELRLKAPSGLPVRWVLLPDIYRIGREELRGLLQAALEEGQRRPGPRPADAFATVRPVLAELERAGMLVGALAALIPLIGLIVAVIVLTLR